LVRSLNAQPQSVEEMWSDGVRRRKVDVEDHRGKEEVESGKELIGWKW